MERIVILDNTAFSNKFEINTIAQSTQEIQFFTTNYIIEEAEKVPFSIQVIEIAKLQNNIHIQDPSPQAAKTIKKYAQKSGDIGALSEQDISIIALAIELREYFPNKCIELMSDDYSIQNVCRIISPPISIINFEMKGISEFITWEVYCPSCYQLFAPEKLKSKCAECNVRLKRRKKRD